MTPVPLVDARFRSRPNRFVVRATLDDGTGVEAHLADPGRLRDLLLPGAALRLLPLPPAASRRLRYRVALVRTDGEPAIWVSLETTRANALAEGLLERGRLRGIGRPHRLRREVRHGSSRFDFRVEHADGKLVWIEVKSVTWVEHGTARFPDAPTARGRRHLLELQQLTHAGARAMVLFVVQRPDAQRLRPCARIDPGFAAALRSARQAGVMLRAAGFGFDPDGRASYLGAVPVRA